MAVLAEPDSSSAVVLEAQKLLNKASKQSRAPEDGGFDKNTVAAIKQFQIECGLKPTGVLDDKVMGILREVANEEPPKWQVTINGKIYLLTDADKKAMIDRVKAEFAAPMRTLRNAVIEARSNYDHMKMLNKDQYIVSWCIEAWKSAKLPAEGTIKSAEQGVDAAEKALASGNLKSFAAIFPKAQEQANKARKEMAKYISDVIDGGETMATGLEIVRDTSFVVVGVIAAPVAAGYGLGAVSAGVVAGAGTAAVEAIANEVGKGISGESKGLEDAALNVLKDAFIGGSIGALLKGGAADKLLEKLGVEVAEKMAGEMVKKAGTKAVKDWVVRYLKGNAKGILEGIMKETMKSFKSSSQPLTVEKFLGIVAKEVVTAGPFKKFEEIAVEKAVDKVWDSVTPALKKRMLKELGDNASSKELFDAWKAVYAESYKEVAGKVYDNVLGKLTGDEDAKAIEEQLYTEFATNAKIIKALEAEVEKRGKQGKKK